MLQTDVWWSKLWLECLLYLVSAWLMTARNTNIIANSQKNIQVATNYSTLTNLAILMPQRKVPYFDFFRVGPRVEDPFFKGSF
jgi:hypothetical protein